MNVLTVCRKRSNSLITLIFSRFYLSFIFKFTSFPLVEGKLQIWSKMSLSFLWNSKVEVFAVSLRSSLFSNCQLAMFITLQLPHLQSILHVFAVLETFFEKSRIFTSEVLFRWSGSLVSMNSDMVIVKRFWSSEEESLFSSLLFDILYSPCFIFWFTHLLRLCLIKFDVIFIVVKSYKK